MRARWIGRSAGDIKQWRGRRVKLTSRSEPDWPYCSIHRTALLLYRDRRHEREKGSVTIVLHAIGRDKAQSRRIDRVTLSGRRCGIDNQMSKMRTAALGAHFDAMHVVSTIVLFVDPIFLDRL